jgi:hypothetical protein
MDQVLFTENDVLMHVKRKKLTPDVPILLITKPFGGGKLQALKLGVVKADKAVDLIY